MSKLVEATPFEAERNTTLLGSSNDFIIYAKELYRLLIVVRITEKDPKEGYYDYEYN